MELYHLPSVQEQRDSVHCISDVCIVYLILYKPGGIWQLNHAQLLSSTRWQAWPLRRCQAVYSGLAACIDKLSKKIAHWLAARSHACSNYRTHEGAHEQ